MEGGGDQHAILKRRLEEQHLAKQRLHQINLLPIFDNVGRDRLSKTKASQTYKVNEFSPCGDHGCTNGTG
jgi:hypothetical protein